MDEQLFCQNTQKCAMCHELFLQLQSKEKKQLRIKVHKRNCVGETKSKIRAEQKHSRVHLERSCWFVRTSMLQVTYVYFHGFKIHSDMIK